MRDTLRKAKPQCLEDLIALNALYRPGPLRGGVVDDYIARKHGRVEIKYELPQMEPLLKETYGVIAYQEQVMRLASELAGFTLGEADELRRAMGKKDAAKMQAQRDQFMHGLHASAASPRRRRTKIFEFIELLRRLRLHKAHSTTYALLAYQTAYLKANYPRHFMAALLTIESQNSDKVALYLAECRDLGVPVLPPDINASRWQFIVEPDGVRFGLGAVKGAGEGAIQSILETRARDGRPHHLALRAGGAYRPAAREQESDRVPGQGRRLRFAGAAAPCGLPGVAPAAARLHSTACSTTAAATRATASRGSRGCSAEARKPPRRCPTPPCSRRSVPGRKPKRSRSRRKHSGCT